MKLEIRNGELRASSPGRLTGYVARFDSETRIGDFAEVIRAGAFRTSLSDGRNIVALADHDRRALLGSTASGTLQLREDAQGLAFELRLPDTSVGRDVAVLVESGLIRGASFGFMVPPGGDTWVGRSDGSMLRELRQVELHEVTVTAQPAYPDTAVAKRSMPSVYETHRVGIGSNRLWLETCL